ncbi:zinc finger SWIM domain-containing protein 3-like [Heterodontus francisci]|uniref:zinc finger SWIM domain-containing protein 3-like n=1 Tax=Heterodontus francisci TaxID=7792 RepID=UPI00355BF1D1
MDGTYKVNKCGYPLYQVMVPDNVGRGRAVFYAMVRNETAQMLDEIVGVFVDFMGSSACRVRLAIVDKDINEINAIRKHLPAATVLLCQFQVVQRMRRKINSYPLNGELRDQLFMICEEMVHAPLEDKITSCTERIGHFYPPLQGYLLTNWIPQKEMWASCSRGKILMFGNNTNNRIKSENGKIKHLLHSSSSMKECISELIFHNSVLDREQSYSTFLQEASFKRITEAPADLQSFYTGFTSHAVKLMHLDHSHILRVNVKQQDKGTVTVISGAKQYALQIHDGQATCSCIFSIQTVLPCKHAIVVQRHLGLPLERLAPNCRWRASQTPTRTGMAAAIVITEEQPRSLSYNEKYRLLSDQLYKLQQAILQSGTASLMRKLDWLRQQTLRCQQGLADEMEPINLHNNCPEAPSNGGGHELDISHVPQSMDPECFTPWANELMDHTYACLFTAPLPHLRDPLLAVQSHWQSQSPYQCTLIFSNLFLHPSQQSTWTHSHLFLHPSEQCIWTHSHLFLHPSEQCTWTHNPLFPHPPLKQPCRAL